jgi:hypothetical protein
MGFCAFLVNASLGPSFSGDEAAAEAILKASHIGSSEF